MRCCPKCHQININQTGEYLCDICGLPTIWDDSFMKTLSEREIVKYYIETGIALTDLNEKILNEELEKCL